MRVVPRTRQIVYSSRVLINGPSYNKVGKVGKVGSACSREMLFGAEASRVHRRLRPGFGTEDGGVSQRTLLLYWGLVRCAFQDPSKERANADNGCLSNISPSTTSLHTLTDP